MAEGNSLISSYLQTTLNATREHKWGLELTKLKKRRLRGLQFGKRGFDSSTRGCWRMRTRMLAFVSRVCDCCARKYTVLLCNLFERGLFISICQSTFFCFSSFYPYYPPLVLFFFSFLSASSPPSLEGHHCWHAVLGEKKATQHSLINEGSYWSAPTTKQQYLDLYFPFPLLTLINTLLKHTHTYPLPSKLSANGCVWGVSRGEHACSLKREVIGLFRSWRKNKNGGNDSAEFGNCGKGRAR